MSARAAVLACLFAAPLVAPLAAAAGCTCDDPPALDDNHFPIARLVLPQLAVTGVGVDVDASGSADEDGGDLAYVYGFGDGSGDAAADDAVFNHVFAAAGTYEVSVTVVDDRAFQASAALSIVVVDGADEGCSCALPCFDDAVCTDRGCLNQASSADDDAAVEFDDAVVCE